MRLSGPLFFQIFLVSLFCLGASSSLYAQTADFSRGTCSQLSEMKGEERNQFLLWLHGYYAGAASRPVLDKGRLEQSINAFNQACEKNPALPLIGIDTRGVMLGEVSAPVTQPQNPGQPETRSGQTAPSPTAPAQPAPTQQPSGQQRPSPIR
jgi:hypothetical protein